MKPVWLPFDVREFLPERDEFAQYCNRTAHEKQARAKWNAPNIPLDLDVVSVTGQLGASIALNRSWDAILREYTPGQGMCQIDDCIVKTTTLPRGGLMVPGDNHDPQLEFLDHPWVLVVLSPVDGVGWVAGWRFGFECRESRWLRHDLRTPMYITPQYELYPATEIRK